MLLESAWGMVIGFALSAVSAVIASIVSTLKMRRVFSVLNGTMSGEQDSASQRAGFREADELARQLAATAQHWESIAANTRDQSSEFQAMLALLDLQGQGEASNRQLKTAIKNLGQAVHAHLTQIEQGAHEMEHLAKAMAENSDAQGNAVIKTTAYIEQLSTTIDSVNGGAEAAQQTLQTASESAASALRLIDQLHQGMQRVQAETQSCEKKLKGLCDPTRQISAIVGSISDIAARTNLLALNASIESIRAGEHGRGFAIVAEEVRNLSEQAADATREITNLLDAMQLATQESIRGIVREREQVETELQRASDAEHSLRKIAQLGNQTRALEQIVDSSSQQLQLAQDVISAIEQLSGLAKANRGHAESIGWTAKKLTDVNPQLGQKLERLNERRGGSGGDATTAPLIPVSTPLPTADLTTIG